MSVARQRMLNTRPLRIAYVLHRFPYLTETFIMREIYWLRKQGIDARVFSLLSPRHALVHEQAKELLPFTHYSPYLSVDVFRAQCRYLWRSPGRYFKAFGNVIRQTFREPRVMMRSLVLFPKSVYFSRLIEEQGIDHIHAHFVWIDGIAAGVVSDLLGISFTIHPHAFGLFSRNQKAVRTELERATQIVTISNFHRKYIQKLCPRVQPDHIHVVYCGIETEHLVPIAIPRLDDTINILSVGRLIEKKGFEYLIDACIALAERGIRFRCRIAGTGPLRVPLQAAITHHGLDQQITLLGEQSQEQILDLYQTSDIFALPCVVSSNGDRDGIPVVLMEAMACKVPVVTTSVTGIPDLVEHGVTGMIVKQRDASSLADVLVTLIGDSDLRRRLGSQGREKILKQFDVQSNVTRLASIFRDVCASRRIASPRLNASKPSCVTTST